MEMIFGQAVNTGDVYVINHKNVVFSVNVQGTGETTCFEDENEAIKYAELKQSLINKK
tara:strand:+ start:946 stop:1119 length:174 start_codon:yes stop_codon:yes gene_type:complete